MEALLNPSAPPVEVVSTQPSSLDIPPPYPATSTPPLPSTQPAAPYPTGSATSNPSPSSTQPVVLVHNISPPSPTGLEDTRSTSNPSAPPIEVVVSEPSAFNLPSPPSYPIGFQSTSTSSLSRIEAVPTENVEHLSVEEPPPYHPPADPPGTGSVAPSLTSARPYFPLWWENSLAV